MQVQSVLIVGAGIGGLATGALLSRRGVEVEIVELKASAEVFGVGINQPGNSLRALDAIGVLPEIREAGFAFDRWVFHDYRGELVVEVPSLLGGNGVPANCGLSRRALHDVLLRAAERNGARIRYGTSTAAIEQTGESVRVQLTDGSESRYDLVVGFDGIKSQLRRTYFGVEHDPTFTGYGVWRVTVPRPPEIDYGAVYQSPFRKAGGHIPLSEDTMYLFLVTPEEEGVHLESDRLPQLLAQRLEGFGGAMGDVRDGLQPGDDVVFGLLSEVLVPPPWSRGRVVLGGDACHACTPHITQGAAMALEDALVLTDELAVDRPVEEALSAYAERRYPRAKFVQDVSHGILEAGMALTPDVFPAAIEQMARELPQRYAAVDGVLNEPA